MLKALYDYGVRNGVSIPPGFVSKPISAYISLSSAGEFLGINSTIMKYSFAPMLAH